MNEAPKKSFWMRGMLSLTFTALSALSGCASMQQAKPVGYPQADDITNARLGVTLTSGDGGRAVTGMVTISGAFEAPGSSQFKPVTDTRVNLDGSIGLSKSSFSVSLPLNPMSVDGVGVPMADKIVQASQDILAVEDAKSASPSKPATSGNKAPSL